VGSVECQEECHEEEDQEEDSAVTTDTIYCVINS
jgi:hypothetical protein